MESLEDFFNRYYNSGLGDCKCDSIDQTFHLDWVFNMEVKILCDTKDWLTNNSVIPLIPKKHRSDLIGMLRVGLNINQAYDTLKETYKF